MTKILYPSQYKYLKKFIREEDTLILEIERFAKQRNIPILSPDSALFLEQLVLAINPKKVLEIGTAIGYSTIRIARCLGKRGIIHTIEKSGDNVRLAEDFVRRSGYDDKILIFYGKAEEVIPDLNKKYDLIFLDSDKEDYKTLFELSLSILKQRGIIFIDNLLWHGFAASKNVPIDYKNSTKAIREFNKYFISKPNICATILPVGDGIGLGIKI